MSKKFFRPPPQHPNGDDDDDDDDSEEDNDDDDDDDDEEESEMQNPNASSAGASSNKAPVSTNLSEDDDDDDEGSSEGNEEEDPGEQDDSEDVETATATKKRKPPPPPRGNGKPPATSRAKKKRKAPSMFDMEAEESGDDDEEEEYGRSNNNLAKDGEQMDEEAQELIRQQDRRRAQASAGGRFGERSVAEITASIEERHRMQRRIVDRTQLLDRAMPEIKAKKQSGASAAASSSSSSARGERRLGDVRSTGGGMVDERVDDDRDIGEPQIGYTAAVAQQSLVPSVSDPSLWMVNCMTGKEQELVFQIMNKCTAFARQGRPLGISAVIAAQSKGKIYIESFSEPAVLEAIQGVRGLMSYSMKLVPIGDMTTVMTVVSKKKPVKKNEWVRMTRGHYKGDLALVRQVKDSGLKCIAQCVPRLDLAAYNLSPEEARIRRRTVRPPMKFFNSQEVASMGDLGRSSVARQRFPGLDNVVCDYFEGNYYHEGYLLKEMTVGSMVKTCTDDDPPTLDELQSFQRRKKGESNNDADDVNEGSKIAASLLDELSDLQGNTHLSKSGAGNGGLMIGDTVEVIEGDLVGMRGKLVSLDGSTVKVVPTNTSVDLGGTNEVEFLSNQVRKSIPVGAHVKVTDGRYANETGVVVAVDQLEGENDCNAVVLTDVTNKEISVRTSQLRESAEVASGQDKLAGYELYDLVILSGGGSANEVGVIVRVGREDFTVINNHGLAREVRPEELRGKRNSTSSRAVALDVQGNQIRVGDSVNVAEGTQKGKTATIKRMSRAQLFLHSQTRSDHAGIFVVRSRSCILAGTRPQSRSAGIDSGVSPFATPQSQSGHGGSAAGRGRKDDGLIGKTVRIQAGQWKGYLGTVSDSTGAHVQVELHSRLKKVMVSTERVHVIGDKFGATDSSHVNEGSGLGIAGVPMTMATPMHALGGATPAIHGFGGATPAHDSGGYDEVWRPGGTIDQDTSEDNDGWGTSDNHETIAANGTNDNDSGWGASNGNDNSTTNNDPAWTLQSEKKEDNASISRLKTEDVVQAPPLKREQTVTAMETEVADVDETPLWFMERVCVQLKESEQFAVIKEINHDKSAVVEMDDKSIRTVRAAEVSMVSPQENDTVLVAGGNEIGLEGSLVCVDGTYRNCLGARISNPLFLIIWLFFEQARMRFSRMPTTSSRSLILSTWSKFRQTQGRQLRLELRTTLII